MIVFTTEISLQNLNSACADLCINRHGSQSFHIGSLLHEVLCLFVVIFWCLGEPRIYHIWAIEVFAALEGVPSDPIIRGGMKHDLLFTAFIQVEIFECILTFYFFGQIFVSITETQSE